jgi:hypothetical protein
MGAVVFWGAVAGVVAGLTALDRRRRKRARDKLEQGSLGGDHLQRTGPINDSRAPGTAEGVYGSWVGRNTGPS